MPSQPADTLIDNTTAAQRMQPAEDQLTSPSRTYIAGLIATAIALLKSAGIAFSAAASGPTFKQGANGRCGTFIANGTTPVAVANTSIAITDAIIISLNTVGGTVGVQPHVATITAAEGFTVVCTASDTSTYNYAILKNAA